mgnify:CR=1 FL=1|jgi:hypothetical protein
MGIETQKKKSEKDSRKRNQKKKKKKKKKGKKTLAYITLGIHMCVSFIIIVTTY